MTPATVVQCPSVRPRSAQESSTARPVAPSWHQPPEPASSVDVAETQVEEPPSAQASCHQCGGEIATDGYCSMCGAKARSPRDHFTEQPATWVAAMCDRGIRHTRNEDAVALDARAEPGSHAVLVVCDGVSNSTDSDVASLAAARAARDTLARSSPSGIGTGAARVAATVQALGAATDAANEAVISNTVEGPGEPASCTFVAAVVDGSLLVVGWVGDSRAYWLPDTGEPVMLTVDDSFASEQIAAGVPRKDAETGPQAHAITRWLGHRRPRPHAATLARWTSRRPDGSWSVPTDSGTTARSRATCRRWCRNRPDGPGTDPLGLAGALVDWANLQGGADNITVHAWRASTPPEQPEGRHARWQRSPLRSTRTSSCRTAGPTCMPSSRSPARRRRSGQVRIRRRRRDRHRRHLRLDGRATRSPPPSTPRRPRWTRCSTASGSRSSPGTTRRGSPFPSPPSPAWCGWTTATRAEAKRADRRLPAPTAARPWAPGCGWRPRSSPPCPGLAQKHAILLTDGINQHETPEQLSATIEARTRPVPVRLPRRRDRLAGRGGTPDRHRPARAAST